MEREGVIGIVYFGIILLGNWGDGMEGLESGIVFFCFLKRGTGWDGMEWHGTDWGLHACCMFDIMAGKRADLKPGVSSGFFRGLCSSGSLFFGDYAYIVLTGHVVACLIRGIFWEHEWIWIS